MILSLWFKEQIKAIVSFLDWIIILLLFFELKNILKLKYNCDFMELKR